MQNKRYFSHPTAVIDDPCEIGEGTKIWHFTHIMAHAKIGKGCTIGQNVFIASDVVIGDSVKIGNNVSVFKGVTIENKVFCAPGVTFTNVINPRAFINRKKEFKETLVQEGATIGARSTIICGNTIGRFAFTGAGTLVTKDVPDYALFYGSPGKLKGWICECARALERISETNYMCKECNKVYKLEGEKLQADFQVFHHQKPKKNLKI